MQTEIRVRKKEIQYLKIEVKIEANINDWQNEIILFNEIEWLWGWYLETKDYSWYKRWEYHQSTRNDSRKGWDKSINDEVKDGYRWQTSINSIFNAYIWNGFK